MFFRIFKFIYRKTFFKLYREFIKIFYCRKVNNQSITIISSNCLAGCIYSDLNKEFLSPTINTFFYAPCFINFCENLDYYLSLDLIETKFSKYTNDFYYPIGTLGDIEIHFLHYKTFDEARLKWNSRKEKIVKDNVRFIMTDRDGFNTDIANRFSLLEGKNNILFTANSYNLKNEVHCTFEKEVISSDFTSFRKYEKYINIVDWYNGK
ncbi:DUF1919 domain-containing protein [Photobacterium leiognathi]|uniref:DUF1919 domain-containing protein n=1 Tax=Photobacterium leiognathi TaxID=553611 RepID=A0ABX5GDB8_PHOLE|nr:DUF1919 domain-containing protein [Photobacterium leiognathi]PSV79946.1 DUF1919 domain-containing protein [Photobacterium leiognathi]